MALAALAAGAVVPAWAQAPAFPQRPITLIVPFAPGGVADITARAVAEAMAASLGQPVVVDNRPSAGSIVASSAVAKAAPDGHRLLLMSNSNALSVSLFRKLPYDVQRDFAPITTLGDFDLGLFVPAASRLGSVADLVASAKAQPGRLTIGTIAVGSTQHLAAELFKASAGIDALVVPYKATPAVLGALQSGEIDVAFEILAPVLPLLAGKRVRALALTGERRNPAWAEAPTVQEAGVGGYVVASWNALAAPAGTPAPVIARLQAAAHAALATPAVQRRLAELGVRARPGTPAQLQALLAAEVPRWAAVIRAAKIEPE
jgi:tripartite-type tricarboxylate transporter receptor subunit TctC